MTSALRAEPAPSAAGAEPRRASDRVTVAGQLPGRIDLSDRDAMCATHVRTADMIPLDTEPPRAYTPSVRDARAPSAPAPRPSNGPRPPRAGASPQRFVAEYMERRVTHPAAGEAGRRPTAEAAGRLVLERPRRGRTPAPEDEVLPGAGFGLRLAQLAEEDLDVGGNRVFDSQVQALCALRKRSARELWSHDTRFVTIPGLRLVHPLR